MPSTVNEHIGPVHNSHLLAFRRCKMKFKYAYIDGLQPKMPSLPLTRGTWIHYCLEAQHLKWGLEDETLLVIPASIHVDDVGEVPIAQTGEGKFILSVPVNEEQDYDNYPLSAAGMLQLLIDHVWSRLFEEEHEKYTEDGHTLPEAVKRILEEYFYHYKEEFQNRDYDILMVETDWKREYKGTEFEGRFDLVIRMHSNGLIVCKDWKSTKREPHPEFKFMESQLNLYPWGVAPMLVELGIPKEDVESMAVEFDYLSTKLPSIPSKNKDGTISKRKINTTYLTLSKALKEYGKEWTEKEKLQFLDNGGRKNFFDRKRLPRNKRVVKKLLDENLTDAKDLGVLLEEPDRATRSVMMSCDWDCDFLPLCNADLYDQNVKHVRLKDYEPRKTTHAGIANRDE